MVYMPPHPSYPSFIFIYPFLPDKCPYCLPNKYLYPCRCPAQTLCEKRAQVQDAHMQQAAWCQTLRATSTQSCFTNILYSHFQTCRLRRHKQSVKLESLFSISFLQSARLNLQEIVTHMLQKADTKQALKSLSEVFSSLVISFTLKHKNISLSCFHSRPVPCHVFHSIAFSLAWHAECILQLPGICPDRLFSFQCTEGFNKSFH